MKDYRIPLFLLGVVCVAGTGLTIHPVTGTADTLTQNIWTSIESWKDDNSDGIFTLDMPDCQMDNNWHFKTDSTLEITEDVVICEPDLPFLDTLSSVWSLKENETVLGLQFPASEEELEFQIFAIGENELILHFIDPDYPNDPVREKIILKR